MPLSEVQYINLIFPLARFKNRQSMKTDLFIWKRGGMTQHFALWVCESVSPSPPWLGHNETCRYKTKRVGLEERKWVLWWSSTGDEITGRLYEKDQNTTSAKHRERHEKEKWSFNVEVFASLNHSSPKKLMFFMSFHICMSFFLRSPT